MGIQCVFELTHTYDDASKCVFVRDNAGDISVANALLDLPFKLANHTRRSLAKQGHVQRQDDANRSFDSGLFDRFHWFHPTQPEEDFKTLKESVETTRSSLHYTMAPGMQRLFLWYAPTVLSAPFGGYEPSITIERRPTIAGSVNMFLSIQKPDRDTHPYSLPEDAFDRMRSYFDEAVLEQAGTKPEELVTIKADEGSMRYNIHAMTELLKGQIAHDILSGTIELPEA